MWCLPHGIFDLLAEYTDMLSNRSLFVPVQRVFRGIAVFWNNDHVATHQCRAVDVALRNESV